MRVKSSQVKSIHKQQTTIRKPIKCAPEASSGGREWAEMTEGFHLVATRRKVLTYVPSEKKYVRSRGPVSADERHSYAEEEIGTRPAGVK